MAAAVCCWPSHNCVLSRSVLQMLQPSYRPKWRAFQSEASQVHFATCLHCPPLPISSAHTCSALQKAVSKTPRIVLHSDGQGLWRASCSHSHGYRRISRLALAARKYAASRSPELVLQAVRYRCLRVVLKQRGGAHMRDLQWPTRLICRNEVFVQHKQAAQITSHV